MLVFYLLRNYRISQNVRKYYFIKTALGVALIEMNLSYFTFVCFSHLKQAFSFGFQNRLELSLTVIFLFSLVLYSVCFYILMFKYLDKQASYFNELTYRESKGFWFKTFYLIAQALRAVVFCFFHYDYRKQLIFLTVIEITMLIVPIVMQSLFKIFFSKAMFSLNVIETFLFVLFNLTLLL